MRCGLVGPVCCGDFEQAPDGLDEYVDATCVNCCEPPARRMAGFGTYERMDCDV